MTDIKIVGSLVNEIKKDINTPYLMCNKKLFDEIMPEVQKQIPGVCCIKTYSWQYFAVTTKAKRKLVRRLNQEIDDYRQKASELSKLVESLE